MSILRYTDSYKLGRILEYPEGTTLVNEVLIPRSVKYFKEPLQSIIKENGIIVAGLQRAKEVTEETLKKALQGLCHLHLKDDFKRILNKEPSKEYLDKFNELRQYTIRHNKLPLVYKWIDEGTRVPVGTPICEIYNSEPEFYWLPNFVETLFLSECWLTIVNATVNFYLKSMLLEFAEATADSSAYTDFQGHDFSMRGNQGLSGSAQVSIGQQMSFVGSDTLYGIEVIQEYYPHSIEEPALCSISAFEHSSVTTNIQHLITTKGLSLKEAEKATLKHFITEVYPDGLVAYVADSYDFWSTIDSLQDLKDIILARDGKLVIRPDSGNPETIICGMDVPFLSLENDMSKHFEEIGLIRALDYIFGHTVNSKGYRVLNSKIGAIYGDGITYDTALAILQRLKYMGYSAENIVFGMGVGHQSHYTRDNLGLALKTTVAKVDDTYINVVKDPKTAKDTSKKSPKGSVKVIDLDGDILWFDADSSTRAIDLYDDLLQKRNYSNLEVWETVRTRVAHSLIGVNNGKIYS